MLEFPQIDPIALQLGPVAIRWYGLAYVAALLLGLSYAKYLARRFVAPGVTPEILDDLFVWVVAGVIVSGRLGFVLFYMPDMFWQRPLDILKIWEGGMSFHGGFLGVVLAIVWFCQSRGIHPADVGDRIAPVVPIGLLFGRLANFINGELWGRPADPTLPWAMIFPHVDALPRHPSQLYEAGLEGFLLLIVLWFVVQRGIRRWQLIGCFIAGYGVARFLVEFFREPGLSYHYENIMITQGQMLCVPMIMVGLWLLIKKR